MVEETARRERFWHAFWPDVHDDAGARDAISVGSWLVFAYAFVSVVNTIVAVIAARRVDPAGAIRPLVLVGVGTASALVLIGFGIRREWRSAAIVGLGITLWSIFIVSIARGMAFWFDLVALLGMINGVRGTFAAHRLRAQSAIARR
jgi:hypothetical protein